jgi:uncharacterized membrane protein
MEENTIQTPQEPTVLKLNNYAKEFLKETAKWAYFLAIVGFIGVGLMILMALFMGAVFSALPETTDIPFNMGPFFTILYLIFAGLYFFPVLYLYRFANKMKMALARNDEDVLTNSFESLKSHYKFMGIMTIVLLAFYALIFILGLFGTLATAM